MGLVRPPELVLPLVAAFSRHAAALDWAGRRLEARWGDIALRSENYAFEQTDYYQSTMGSGLQKVFFALAEPADPARLPEWKLQTNLWEEEYADSGAFAESRPLNLDPGYLTLGKLVLASTKDFAHRIYLAHGIYAEVTLLYRHRRWQAHEWTFPDYSEGTYHAFFHRCREYLHRRLREAASP